MSSKQPSWSSVQAPAEDSYQNPPLLSTYEDTLYQRQKRKMEVKNIREQSYNELTHCHAPRSPFMESRDVENNSIFHRKKIREITCLNCQCIHNVGLIEKAEDIWDIVKNLSFGCGATVLCTLPHAKKKLNGSSNIRKQSVLVQRDPFLRQCLGKTLASSASGSSLHERKHSISRSVAHGGVKQRGLSNLQHYSKPFFPKCLEPSKSKIAANRRNDSQISSAGLGAAERLLANPTSKRDRRPERTTNNRRPIVLSQSIGDSKGNLTLHNPSERQSLTWVQLYTYYNRPFSTVAMKPRAGKRPVRVHLLTGDSVLLVFETKAYVQEVFDQVCAMQSIKESHFFGLSAFIENEERFVDLKQKLLKYAPKEWGREIPRRASNHSLHPSVFTLQFQVQFFVEHPKLICDHQSRYHYYLQLKRNVLRSKAITQDETIITLAAIALHLDKGPFDPEVHKGHYFDPHQYVPSWFLETWDENYLWSHLPTLHAELSHTSPFVAQADYIKLASRIDDVPVHYYKLFKTKKEVEPSVILGVFHQGIRIHHINPHQNPASPHLLDFEFPWSKVGRLFFSAKRFEIYPEDLPPSRKLIYYTESKSRSKYLLRLLRETHSLHASLSPFVQHTRQAEGRINRKWYRESYISGMNLEERLIGGVRERLVGGLDETSPDSIRGGEGNGKAFTSYKSTTSHGSSHTSGIESDSKQRPEDVEQENSEAEQRFAFAADDFDPIEHDAPSSDQVKCINENHLAAPSSSHLCAVEGAVLPNDQLASTERPPGTSCDDAAVPGQNAVVIHAPQNPHQSSSSSPGIPVSEISSDSAEAILLVAQTLAVKTSFLRKSVASSQKQDPATENIFHGQSSADIRPNAKNSSDVVQNAQTSTTPIGRFHVQKSASDAAIAEILQKASLEPPTRFEQQGSYTYYDDTDTIPRRQERARSVDVDAAHILYRKRSHGSHGNSSNSKDRYRKDQGHSRDSEKPCSSHTERKHRKKRRSKLKGDNSSQQQQRTSTLANDQSLPSNIDTGADLQCSGSLEKFSVPDTEFVLHRSGRQADIPKTFCHASDSSEFGNCTRSAETASALSSTSTSADISRQDSSKSKERSKSNTCQQTNAVAVQHTKTSGKKQSQHKEKRLCNGASRTPRKTTDLCSGDPGCTPKKSDVLLRAKRGKSGQNRTRPLSHHVTTDNNHYTNANYVKQNNRSSLYIDFKEVIV